MILILSGRDEFILHDFIFLKERFNASLLPRRIVTTWNRVVIEKPVAHQSVKKFPIFY